MAKKVNPKDYYFSAMETDTMNGPYVLIVEKKFWNKNHYIDDQTPDVHSFLPDYLEEMSESMWSYDSPNLTLDQVIKDLINCGFEYNSDLDNVSDENEECNDCEDCKGGCKGCNDCHCKSNEAEAELEEDKDDGIIKFKFIKFNPDGSREYFLASAKKDFPSYGYIHYRENGPSIVHKDGTEEYYINGYKGRLDGPTVVSPTGYQEYWTNGKIGRKEGPAIIYADGGKDWLWDGLYHRKEGPAREFSDGTKHYFYEGKQIFAANDKEFIKKIKFSNLMF